MNFLLLTTPYDFTEQTEKKTVWFKPYVILLYLTIIASFINSMRQQLLFASYTNMLTEIVMNVILYLVLFVTQTLLVHKALFRSKQIITFMQTFAKFDAAGNFMEKINYKLYWILLIGAQLIFVVQFVVEIHFAASNKILWVVINRFKVCISCNMDIVIWHYCYSSKQRFSFINEQLKKISAETKNMSVLREIQVQFMIISDMVLQLNRLYSWQILAVLCRTLCSIVKAINFVIVRVIYKKKPLNHFELILHLVTLFFTCVSYWSYFYGFFLQLLSFRCGR